MSIAVMTRVWAHSTLSGTELLLLLAIADHANDNGIAWPSVEALARKIRMSERACRYLLPKIAATGELAIERNAGPKGCNLFRVQVLQGANLSGVQSDVSGGAKKGGSGGATAIAPEPSVNHQRTTRASSASPPVGKKSSPAIEPIGFSDCWAAYPKRSGGNSRKEAEKAYRARLKTGVDPADLLTGVQRYAAYIRGTEREGTAYVKQTATFFGTGEHWLEAWAIPTAARGKRAVDADTRAFDYASSAPVQGSTS